MRFALAFLLILGMERDASADVVIVSYHEGGSSISITRSGNVDAVLRSRNRVQMCHYAIDPKVQTDLTTAMQEPSVVSAFLSHAVFDGKPSRIVMAGDTIEWKPHAPTSAPSMVSLFRLELEVEMIKALARCP